jgi:hopene-associated glycosyltransferase HpnB
MTTLAILSLLVWVYLLGWRGRFWQSGPELTPELPASCPSVLAVVPARDEAASIAQSLGSLLAQDYPQLSITLVDDDSTDDTQEIASGLGSRLTVLTGAPCPPGWSGKLWAIAQGIGAAEDGAEFVLLTDADIVHAPTHVATLVAQAERDDLDLVSEMAALACESFAERALIPAFVFFFQLLYPFASVNDPLRAAAAAAGGTILIRRRALKRIGGVAAVRHALIDDIALATAVKAGGRIWLGHSGLARSIRRYRGADEIWRMIARTAYVQLCFSPFRLAACLVAMALAWIVPPLAALVGPGAAHLLGILAWAALAWSYLPTLRRFGVSTIWAPALPLVALFYMAATVGAAANHHFGAGVRWKGRTYGQVRA